MTDDQLERFAQFVEAEKVPQWSVIVKQGDPGDSMYFILEGELRARINVMGNETILATLSAGDFFGDISLFDHGPRSADVVANSDSLVVKISAEAFDQLAKEAPEIATPFLRAVGRTLSARIRTDNKRYGDSVKFSSRRLVPQQLLQGVPGLGFAGPVFGRGHKLTPDELEILAVIGQVLFRHEVGAAIAALFSDARVVADAVEANLQVRVAAVAGFGTARRARQLVFQAALPTMTCHCHAAYSKCRGRYFQRGFSRAAGSAGGPISPHPRPAATRD